MANEKQLRIQVPIVPTVDKKASRAALAEIKQLERELGSLKTSYNDIIRASRNVIQELRKMPSELEKVNKSVSMPGAEGKKSKSTGHGPSQRSSSDIVHTKASRETERAAKFQRESQKRIEALQKQRFGAMLSFIKSAPGAMSKGGYKSAFASMGRSSATAMTATKDIAQIRGGASGSIITAISKAGPAMAMAATAITAVAQAFMIASDNQAKLNRALMDGSGTASDFGQSVENYRGAVRDLNQGVLDSSRSFLSFGGSSEKAAKTLSAFSKESSGSMLRLRNEMASLGGRDGVSGGIKIFYQAAHSYGSALNMSAEQTGELMGRMSQEMGKSAEGTIESMGNIVQAAAKSNMPMSKFMEIFHSVIPGVELYQNRLEELTGTIKLLSKSMSPKDVKNFMDAFQNGFKGTSFRDRLKTALIVGVGTVNKALGDDFETKIKSMADSIGVNAQDMWKAAQKGEKGMADFLTAQEARGKVFTGTQKGEAMKLSMYERSRQRGGALNIAEAMPGAGMLSTYKIIQNLSKRFAGNESGLREHVTKALGVSDAQYDAVRSMERSITKFQSELQASGGQLQSKSLQEGLEKIMTDRLNARGQFSEENLKKALMSANADDLMKAAELSNYMEKSMPKSLDMAEAQYNMTSSIGDKIENVVGYLLEQIASTLNSALDVLNDILMWFMGDKDNVKASKKVETLADDMISYNKDLFADKSRVGAKEMMKSASSVLAKAASEGKIGRDASNALYDSDVFDFDKISSLTGQDYDAIMEKITGRKGEGDFLASKAKGPTGIKDMFDALGDMDPGGQSLMRFTEYMAQVGKISESAKNEAMGIAKRRPGSDGPKTVQDLKKENENQDVNDKFAEQAKLLQDQKKNQEAQKKIMEETQRSGQKIESSQLKNEFPEAVNKGVATALASQAAKEAVINSDPVLAQHKAELLAQSGLKLPEEMHNYLKDQSNPLKPGYATGGPINYDQVANVHKGEFVVPKNGALIMSGSGGFGGPKIGNLSVIVNVKTDADAKQIANEVVNIHSRT